VILPVIFNRQDGNDNCGDDKSGHGSVHQITPSEAQKT
jgi:hypothetical protein